MTSAEPSKRFDKTSRAISRDADCAPAYVTLLARKGALPHIVASNGVRLFSEEAVDIVRKIKAARMANRGKSRGRE